VHVAGHDGGQPTAFFVLSAGGNLAELPTVIERQYRILRRFRMSSRSSTSLPESCTKQGNTYDTTGYNFRIKTPPEASERRFCGPENSP